MMTNNEPHHLDDTFCSLREALRGAIEVAEFWINREDTRDFSEEQFMIWLALGHRSRRLEIARAALKHADGLHKAKTDV